MLEKLNFVFKKRERESDRISTSSLIVEELKKGFDL